MSTEKPISIDKDAAKRSITARHQADPELNRTFHLAEAERVEIEGRKSFFALRSRWSNWIVGWITAFIVFHIALTFCIGINWLDFTKHQWMVPLIVVENFLQIVGMGYIVVRFLYPGGANTKA